MDLIDRPEAMNFLLRWQDKQLIKVVSGVRRCGKSTLLTLFKRHLLNTGVDPKQIQFINFEDLRYEKLAADYRALYDYLSENLVTDRQNYIFLDEIQHVFSFEKAVDSLFLKENVDIYLTGSNAYFLSGELATLLSGRYAELKLLPLSFKEYSQSPKARDRSPKENFREYLKTSSLPYALNLDNNLSVREYLDGTFSTIVLKDVVQRFGISDISMLQSVTTFLLNTVGNLISPRKIAAAMTSLGRKVDGRTVEKYIQALTDSLLFYKALRYDLKGKQILDNSAKYYVVDLGFRNLLTNGSSDRGFIIENLVYLELLRRDYKVYVGKTYDNGEVDFVAIKGQEINYYQVSLSVLDPQTLKRELSPLQKIKDNYPKYLLSLDDALPEGNYDGILQRNLIDWLLN